MMSTLMSPHCSTMVMCVMWEFVFIVTVMDTDIYYTKQTLEWHYNNGMCVYRIGSLGALCALSVYPPRIKVSVRMLLWYNVPQKGSHTNFDSGWMHSDIHTISLVCYWCETWTRSLAGSCSSLNWSDWVCWYWHTMVCLLFDKLCNPSSIWINSKFS